MGRHFRFGSYVPGAHSTRSDHTWKIPCTVLGKDLSQARSLPISRDWVAFYYSLDNTITIPTILSTHLDLHKYLTLTHLCFPLLPLNTFVCKCVCMDAGCVCTWVPVCVWPEVSLTCRSSDAIYLISWNRVFPWLGAHQFDGHGTP